MAAELESLGVPCAGLMPVGLDTAIIPDVPAERTKLRRAVGLDPDAKILVFVGRLDPYKRPLDLVPLLKAAPHWQAVIIGQGSQAGALSAALAQADLTGRCRAHPQTAQHGGACLLPRLQRLCEPQRPGDLRHELAGGHVRGCPPVARHAPGPDLIIEDGVSGMLCDTVEEMAAALDRVTTPWAPPPRSGSTNIFCGRTAPSWR